MAMLNFKPGTEIRKSSSFEPLFLDALPLGQQSWFSSCSLPAGNQAYAGSQLALADYEQMQLSIKPWPSPGPRRHFVCEGA